MIIQSKRNGDHAILELTGDLDMRSRAEFTTAVANVIGDGASRRVLIDMSNITFCDSTGFGALLNVRRAAMAQGTDLRVINLPEKVRGTLLRLGLLEYLESSALADPSTG